MIHSDSYAKHQPFDCKTGDSWLLCEYVSSDLLEDGLCWRIRIELLGVILVIDIVPDSHKFSAVVGTCKKDDGDTEDFGIWDSVGVGGVRFEDEFVDTDGYWTDEE